MRLLKLLAPASSRFALSWAVVLSLSSPQGLAAGACPLATAQQWQQFLTATVHQDFWARSCEQDCSVKLYQHVDTTTAQVLAACQDELAAVPELARCTANLRRFLPAWLRAHDADSYGFSQPNRSYFAAQEDASKPPGMMQVPDLLTAALPTRAKVEETAREQGWQYLTHPSAIHGLRTILFIPDAQGRFDRWILVNFEDDPSQITAPAPVSFLAVQRTTRDGHLLPRVQLHFRSYTAAPAAAAPATYQLRLDETFSGKCFSCHPSGVRQLIARMLPDTSAAPVRGEPGFAAAGEAAEASRSFAGARLLAFNTRLASYQLPDWAGTIDPAAFGPALGAQQGCTRCHNDLQRGRLTAVMSSRHIAQKVSAELAMPPEPGLVALLEKSELDPDSLTSAEAGRLSTAQAAHDRLGLAFEHDRLPLLQAWLLATPCTPP